MRVSRQQREGFQHAGKRPGDGAKDSSMLESVPAMARKMGVCHVYPLRHTHPFSTIFQLSYAYKTKMASHFSCNATKKLMKY